MRLGSKIPIRLAAALGVSALILAVGGASGALAGSNSGGPQTIEPGTLPAIAFREGTPPMSVSSTTGVTAPLAWCCPGGSAPGLSVTGQATVHGHGSAARDAAIAQAVADATDQARTAAQAAGVTLGPIVDFQISSPPYPYPLGMGIASSQGMTPSTSRAPGSSAGGVARPCPASIPCPPTAAPVAYQTFASVTITWAIG